MIKVFCLDDGKNYYFDSNNGFDAIKKMQYTLNTAHKDTRSKISMTDSGLHWVLEHSGKTYSTRI